MDRLSGTDPQIHSGLFSLPPELRDAIYEQVFDNEYCLVQEGIFCDECPGHKFILSNPPSSGLLLSCKLAHAEAITMYYRYSTFKFINLNPYDIRDWILRRAGATREIITKIEVPKRYYIEHSTSPYNIVALLLEKKGTILKEGILGVSE